MREIAGLKMAKRSSLSPFCCKKGPRQEGGKPAAARVEGIGICLAVLFQGLSNALESFFDVFERRGV